MSKVLSTPMLDAPPSGGARMAPSEVAASQRARLLRAMAEVTAAKGYPNVTVADVVAAAKVSRQTFYEQFTGLQDCYLAAYDACTRRLYESLARTAEAIGGDGRARLGGAVRCYLELLSSEPAIAKAYLVDVYAVGPEAAVRRLRSQHRFAGLLKSVHRELRAAGDSVADVDAFTYEALVGAVSSVVTNRVAAGEAASLPKLATRIERFLLAALLA